MAYQEFIPNTRKTRYFKTHNKNSCPTITIKTITLDKVDDCRLLPKEENPWDNFKEEEKELFNMVS